MRKLLIIDLEATCWESAEHDPDRMETIEIGALLVAPEAPAAAREFQTLVRPTRCPVLSPFCTRLTTIRQADVDAAEPFAAAFARFVAWIGDPPGVLFASWGSYDRKQLVRDCALHGVAYPFGDEHLNLKRLCSARLGLRPAGVQQALSRAGLEFQGTHHRALDDVRNIWRLTRTVCDSSLVSLCE